MATGLVKESLLVIAGSDLSEPALVWKVLKSSLLVVATMCRA